MPSIVTVNPSAVSIPFRSRSCRRLSNGWMRYVTTKMMIERALSDFRFEWMMMVAKLGGQKPTTDQVQLTIQRVKEFASTINNHVDQETQAWVSEFKTSIAEIEKTAKEQTAATGQRRGATWFAIALMALLTTLCLGRLGVDTPRWFW